MPAACSFKLLRSFFRWRITPACPTPSSRCMRRPRPTAAFSPVPSRPSTSLRASLIRRSAWHWISGSLATTLNWCGCCHAWRPPRWRCRWQTVSVRPRPSLNACLQDMAHCRWNRSWRPSWSRATRVTSNSIPWATQWPDWATSGCSPRPAGWPTSGPTSGQSEWCRTWPSKPRRPPAGDTQIPG